MNSKVGLRDVADGSSNTVMIGERSVIGRSGIWPGPRSNFLASDVVSDGGYASPINSGDTSFSTRRPQGLHCLICDGSVRLIRTDIDSSPDGGIFQALCSRSGGEVLGEF